MANEVLDVIVFAISPISSYSTLTLISTAITQRSNGHLIYNKCSIFFQMSSFSTSGNSTIPLFILTSLHSLYQTQQEVLLAHL